MENIIGILWFLGICFLFYAIGWIGDKISNFIEFQRYKKLLHKLEPQATKFDLTRYCKLSQDVYIKNEKNDEELQLIYPLKKEENHQSILETCLFVYNEGRATKRKQQSRKVRRHDYRRSYYRRYY